MAKFLFLSLLAATAAVATAEPAWAGGGMGDCSAHIREMNAICEMQRRGEGPLSPNVCLPEYPPGAPPGERPRRGN